MSRAHGVRLALDWGLSRIGVAACDAQGVLAYPVTTITPAQDRRHVTTALAELVAEYEPTGILVGLPRHLGGAEGENARMVRAWAGDLAARFPAVAIRLVDERLSTRSAERDLQAAGRTASNRRGIIDQAAAVAILNAALDQERASGTLAGELIQEAGTR
ncbi:MAG: Holliday junction resolvase RuvX [Propioniciclava sp.]